MLAPASSLFNAMVAVAKSRISYIKLSSSATSSTADDSTYPFSFARKRYFSASQAGRFCIYLGTKSGLLAIFFFRSDRDFDIVLKTFLLSSAGMSFYSSSPTYSSVLCAAPPPSSSDPSKYMVFSRLYRAIRSFRFFYPYSNLLILSTPPDFPP